MKMMTVRYGVLSCVVMAAPGGLVAWAALPIDTITLPPGFEISIFAENVQGARSMALSPSGVVYVGSRSPGTVYALLDMNDDYVADEVITIASGLNNPNGVAIKNGDLYVAEIHRIIRFDAIDHFLDDPPDLVVVYDQLPTEPYHGWRYIQFGPDGKLYIPIGSSCHCTNEADPRFNSITRINSDGTGFEIYATGIRNTVGFDWHPVTGELWFTENGHDPMGDDIPPDELNHAPVKDMHFGYPYCHGDDIFDPDFGAQHACSEFTPPVSLIQAHAAALGMKFYTGTMFPEKYHHAVFVAEHGSWASTKKVGYRVEVVTENDDGMPTIEPFAEGWLQSDESFWGRPVDVLQMPDGSLLVSDDFASAIYRIRYVGEDSDPDPDQDPDFDPDSDFDPDPDTDSDPDTDTETDTDTDTENDTAIFDDETFNANPSQNSATGSENSPAATADDDTAADVSANNDAGTTTSTSSTSPASTGGGCTLMQ